MPQPVPCTAGARLAPKGNDEMSDAPGSAPRTGMTTVPPGAGSPLPHRTGNSGLVLLIVAGLSTLVGFLLAAPAVILAILAMVNQDQDPSRAARLARWGWTAYGVAMTLMLTAAALLFWIAGLAAGAN